MPFPVRALPFLAAFLFTVPAFAQQTPGTGANYEMRLENLEEQMRVLQGRIEQLEFSIRRMDQALQRIQGDAEERLSKLESAPPAVVVTGAPQTTAPAATNFAPTANVPAAQPQTPPPPANAQQPVPVAPVKGSLGAIKVQDGRVTGGVVNPQAPPLPNTPPDYSLTPQEQYDRAFDLLRKTDYDGAGDAFKSFIEKNPQDKLIDDAKFWYGETLYVRDKFDLAAVAFADAYQQNPQGSKAADSLLKLAMSLEKLGKIPDACTTLESLKTKYTSAPAKIRQQADQERTKLKCNAAAH